ncbi:MAG: HAMP domain-containing sensor histidine kinase [Thermoguttaceae bacterium]|jgi:signal transduction histidine kinase
MSVRRSLRLPIILAIVMIALLVVLTVGWVLLNVFGALKDDRMAGVYWALLSIGATFIGMLLAGVIMYLVLMIKSINLNRRQSNFIDSVTHELKSPIASMKLCLQTLNRRQVSQQEQANFYRYMLEDIERLDHLINQLLGAGRVEAGRVDGEVEEVSLAPLLLDCVSTVCVRYRVPSEAVHLELQPCVVRARRVDLDIIFRNLIDNAVKYAGNEPWIGVTLGTTAEGWAVARISDNGRGIPLKFRRRIFGRFERLGFELERDKPGTGLGLYIVRTLVRRLKGRIRVGDREGGPGTVFEVQIPGAVAEPAAAEKPG